MARVLVIRPDELSPAGLIAESLERAEIHAVTVKLDEGDAPPDDLDAYDGALLLGGPQSVVEEKDAVLIADCTEVARRYNQAGKPLLGICLGAQVIAHVLGARVWRLDRLQFDLQNLVGSGIGAAWAALVNRAAGKAVSGPDDQHNRPAKV